VIKFIPFKGFKSEEASNRERHRAWLAAREVNRKARNERRKIRRLCRGR
jgi:hypothetical protein